MESNYSMDQARRDSLGDAAEEASEEAEEEEVGEEADEPIPDAEASPTDASSDYYRVIKALHSLESLSGLRELGREALCWRLSSAKPGNGVEQLIDPSHETYWQSDGNSQPHWIQLHFGRRVAISHVCLYLDYQLDESYTPRRVIVEIGLTQQDLIPASQPVELIDPCGWCIIPLQLPPDPLDDPAQPHSTSLLSSSQTLIKTHLLRVSILSMHQNGRDTHVRNMHLYGPRTDPLSLLSQSSLTTWNMMSPVAESSATPASRQGRRRDGSTDLSRVNDMDEGFSMLQSFSAIR